MGKNLKILTTARTTSTSLSKNEKKENKTRSIQNLLQRVNYLPAATHSNVMKLL